MGLNLADIQGNIVPGFDSRFQEFVFVRFEGTATDTARDWLRAAQRRLTSAADVTYIKGHNKRRAGPAVAVGAGTSSAPWVNLALSWQGLQQLEATERDRLPAEFTASPEARARELGDLGNRWQAAPTGHDAWSEWEVGSETSEADVLLMLGTRTKAELDVLRDEIFAEIKQHRLPLPVSYRGERRVDGTEQFGFADGGSQPVPNEVTDSGWRASSDGQIVAPGEFIIGQPGEGLTTPADGPSWATDGSYVVFRRLRQNVPQFWANVGGARCVLDDNDVPGLDIDTMALKIMGRSPGQDNTMVPLFQSRWGDDVPLFAHTRKAHPRNLDVLADGTVPRQHRIIRRGIPYTNNKDDRGLLFVAFQASIARQFKYIQTRFLNDAQFPRIDRASFTGTVLSAEARKPGPDPVAGLWGSGDISVRYPRPDAADPAREVVELTLKPVVSPLGSGYFFAPSLSAVAALAR
jgi:Dyp-type peroxidase family